jgi:hypothetical protein
MHRCVRTIPFCNTTFANIYQRASSSRINQDEIRSRHNRVEPMNSADRFVTGCESPRGLAQCGVASFPIPPRIVLFSRSKLSSLSCPGQSRSLPSFRQRIVRPQKRGNSLAKRRVLTGAESRRGKIWVCCVSCASVVGLEE